MDTSRKHTENDQREIQKPHSPHTAGTVFSGQSKQRSKSTKKIVEVTSLLEDIQQDLVRAQSTVKMKPKTDSKQSGKRQQAMFSSLLDMQGQKTVNENKLKVLSKN